MAENRDHGEDDDGDAGNGAAPLGVGPAGSGGGKVEAQGPARPVPHPAWIARLLLHERAKRGRDFQQASGGGGGGGDEARRPVDEDGERHPQHHDTGQSEPVLEPWFETPGGDGDSRPTGTLDERRRRQAEQQQQQQQREQQGQRHQEQRCEGDPAAQRLRDQQRLEAQLESGVGRDASSQLFVSDVGELGPSHRLVDPEDAAPEHVARRSRIELAAAVSRVRRTLEELHAAVPAAPVDVQPRLTSAIASLEGEFLKLLEARRRFDEPSPWSGVRVELVRKPPVEQRRAGIAGPAAEPCE
jgi:hypothetical protein